MTHAKSVSLTRRSALGAGVGMLCSPVLAQPSCELGLPGHVKGSAVWRDYDQAELDAAYNQTFYQAHLDRVNDRLGAQSFDLRFRRGYPDRLTYGEHPDEKLDLYRTAVTPAPIFIFIHGGIWIHLDAATSGFAAEMFMDHGAHFAALDFAPVTELGGDLAAQAAQVRRGIAWIARNAASLGADPERIYIGGHSSGGHLCAVALTTDWVAEFGLPRDVIKGGLCMSGMYDLEPVRLSWRSSYLAFTDEMEAAMSPQRHIDRIAASLTITYGSYETPEFQRQAKDFTAAVQATGKPVALIGGTLHHQETWESLGNPYGLNGRAALDMMQI
ncbi:alpha/beta hydrolase fold domain-containing protein [Paracoccus aestuariivivens]|uniref:alpha/beta hydrolase fold domain-containing protein n=1 Tax=Paracoccus aestuariivivens TaxID=1820333 RepID=UPI0014793C33